MPRLLLILVSFLAVGCNSVGGYRESISPVKDKDFIFSVLDQPESERFLITIKSLESRALCITRSYWPTEKGKLEGASNHAVIEVGGKQFSFKNYDMEYCPFRSCVKEIGGSEQVQGYLRYEDFDLPKELYSRSKTLMLFPKPFWCDEGRWMM